MGWPNPLLDLANKLAREVKQTVDEVSNSAEKVIQEISGPKSQVYSYQGAPGRQHNNETVIVDGSPSDRDNERQVTLACRVVGGGFAGGALGGAYKYATDLVAPAGLNALAQSIPNPSYHWCITVGDYLHQLQATSLNGGWNYYTNERINRGGDGWSFYPVGRTRLNDVAIRDVSTQVMNDMPEIYHALNNNCQHFTLRLADRILTSTREQKFLMVNMTYGIQKQPEMDIKMLNRVTVTRIDTGEVVDPATLEPIASDVHVQPEVAPGAIEEVSIPAAVPVAEKTPLHGEAVVVGGRPETQEDDISRAEVLRGVAAIMIKKTPTLTKEDVENALEAASAPAAQVLAV